ncbi:MAG TPA: MATE family efflux transporter [Halieaceae bacterium]|jgi:MATE family multidrug resistance protein|uniref:MATE family efflux transporter n=1 Tax=Haliea TaxID=475794 RepID=UPI000C605FF0|nr:MATE family efflux transporter [Haliea sp.]HBM82553.1 MATE family efflux transporter [Halieaceae bacterium]MAY91975.1 MATE family efflux transporter [Haliea sp.]MBK41899.1 MATE family efflux transporter [Haliea sp.]MBP69923.1 MATE family efflux transporter [Haliea sp.]HBQ40095.1 MATE family efflux transporter [Halieaceae bacterium]|tara:strand:+ start:6203 stop:7528 length:1326 start_codon:yes stop_codon:yes gene_type:complete
MGTATSLDHKIWQIAWPAILSNISIPLLGLVDAGILGHLDDTRYLGAVAIGSALLSFLYWGFSFLRMGTTGRVARALGAGSEAQASLELYRAGVLALALAGLVWLLHPLWLHAGLALMAPDATLLPLADSYARIRIISAPAVLMTYAIIGWFIGHGDTRWPMWVLIVTNLTNIALDVLFVVGLGWASDGAALATVLAEYTGLGLALFAVRRRLAPAAAPGRGELLDVHAYISLMRSNSHLFVRTITLLAAFAFFTSMGEKLGTATLAANALLMQLLLLTSYALDGFAYAAESLAGNRAGANDPRGFYQVVRRCGLWCAGSALALSIAFLVLQLPLFRLLTSLPDVLLVLDQHRLWLVLLPLVAAPTYLLDGVFIGTGETRPMMRTMLASALLVYLPVWYVTQPWGNHGLWLAFTLFNAARGLTLYSSYRRLSAGGGWFQCD